MINHHFIVTLLIYPCEKNSAAFFYIFFFSFYENNISPSLFHSPAEGWIAKSFGKVLKSRAEECQKTIATIFAWIPLSLKNIAMIIMDSILIVQYLLLSLALKRLIIAEYNNFLSSYISSFCSRSPFPSTRLESCNKTREKMTKQQQKHNTVKWSEKEKGLAR